MKSIVHALMVGAICWGVIVPAHAQQAPHASHGPRLGGLFAAAAGDTLHVEFVFSEQRRVRLFVTDASAAPLPLERLRAMVVTAIAGDREFPFALIEADAFFEARLPTLPLPATIGVSLASGPGSPADRLTFTFYDYSPGATVEDFSPVEIPGTLAGIVTALAGERRGIAEVVERQEFVLLLGSEDRIRDLTLAIDPYLEPLIGKARLRADMALTEVIRACWLLHTTLDYGTIAQRDAAVAQLGAALDEMVAAVSSLTP